MRLCNSLLENVESQQSDGRAEALDIQESIDRFSHPLAGLLMSWGAPALDAAELAQDSLADAYMGRATCRGDVNDPFVFGRWLRGIARNKFRAWSRNRSRRERLANLTAPEMLDQVAAMQPVFNERLVKLRAEILRLPKGQREVVMMHYLDETPVANVAALLSITLKSVEGRLYQARKTLRRQMNKSTSWTDVAKAVLL